MLRKLYTVNAIGLCPSRSSSQSSCHMSPGNSHGLLTWSIPRTFYEAAFYLASAWTWRKTQLDKNCLFSKTERKGIKIWGWEGKWETKRTQCPTNKKWPPTRANSESNLLPTVILSHAGSRAVLLLRWTAGCKRITLFATSTSSRRNGLSSYGPNAQ
jgi:hypothetical protein